MAWIQKTVLFLLILLTLSGCMSFNYVGQKFSPLPQSEIVTVFEGRAKIPADKFRIIGRGTLTGPWETDRYDRMAELRAQARKYGADALCIVENKRVEAGFYPQDNGTFAPPLSAQANKDNLSNRGTAWENDSFGQIHTLREEKKRRYEFEIKVLFLKNQAAFDREMEKR